MITTDIFKMNRSSRRLNETMEKTFGRKLNLASFDIPKLEDARNKLRTQVSQSRSTSGFNETIENAAFTEAQWMLDSINAELATREESATFTENEIRDSDMRYVNEGEIQQASAIVTAKTMVDRVSRWIEELSGMENDTLLSLGDSIRDEMSQEQAKVYISTVAPAVQQALTVLKDTREILATGVRSLTGEEQSAEMLGNPEEDEVNAAEPDAMNAPDDFAVAEPAAGGIEAAGREQRESINYQNKLMKVLAG